MANTLNHLNVQESSLDDNRFKQNTSDPFPETRQRLFDFVVAKSVNLHKTNVPLKVEFFTVLLQTNRLFFLF